MRSIFVGCLFFLLPVFAQAAVTFSEVAWMGSAASANYEWIELHNDGEAMDVSGWAVRDGMNLDIALGGVIPANSYVVLERTSDESAVGTAFLIYTGALVNTGATLQLLRADGSVADQVSGGEDWQNIGGDNVTKETAQYTSSGWVSAAATPGRAITTTEITAAADTQTEPKIITVTSSGSLQKPLSSEPVVLTLPDVTLKLMVTAQKLGYVHQPIKFSVEPSGIGDSLIDSLQYEWNFGDALTENGKEATHVYEYPGTYVVTVYAGFKRQEQVARHEVTILPVTVSLTTNDVGDVQVNNDSPYEIDLSGYRIKATSEFTFPPRTVLLPNQTITIPYKKVGATRQQLIALYDTEAALVASKSPASLAVALARKEIIDHSPQPMISAVSYTPPKIETAEAFTFVATENAEELVVEATTTLLEQSLPVSQQANVGAAPQPSGQRWPYLALAGTLLIATLGLYAAPRRNETERNLVL